MTLSDLAAPTTRRDHLGPATLVLLGVAAAVATSTGYAVHPELDAVARDLDSSVAVVGAASAAAVAGYLVGLAALVPLVDFVRPHRLVPGQLAALAASLLVASAAGNAVVRGLCLFSSGVCASTGAQLSTLASTFADPARRGLAVGMVTSGIAAGVLLGRLVGGVLAEALGWRPMLACLAGACLLCAAACRAVLPRRRPRPTASYRSTVAGLPRLVAADGRLRVAAVSGALWFFAFSLVWVALSVALAQPPLDLGPAEIGRYAFAGLLGMAVTTVAGHCADRWGARTVVVTGLVVALGCTLVLAVALEVPLALVAALALFDAGLFAAQVANQSRLLGLAEERATSYNSAYLVVCFVGGSLGTAVGGALVTGPGWPVAAATAGAALVVALGLVVVAVRD